MKIAVCAIAKNENDYINDWCLWHIFVGFDHIFLYDNNDDSTPFVGDRIDKNIREKVTITNVHGKSAYQVSSYNDCYAKNNKDFDWIAFIDIDEFLIYDKSKYKSIKDFISEPIFSHCNVIRPCWQIFGDDNKIKDNISIPVWKRIRIPLNIMIENRKAKCIVRCGVSGLSFRSAHSPYINGKIISHVDAIGRRVTDKVFIQSPCYKNCYINHYMTKTLSEFVKNKVGRGDAIYGKVNIGREYYFKINRWTKQKDDYIKQFE